MCKKLTRTLENRKIDPTYRRQKYLENAMEQKQPATPDTEASIESNPASEANEVMPSPEELLQAAERKAQEHYDAWMYAKAESENIRRRASEDVSKAQKFAVERFSNEVLAVKDSLEAGLAVETATVESFKSGMELTLKQLSSVFEKFNILEINPVGEKLDPHKHQAISMVPSEQPANTVVSVMQKGYTLNDRVLRPALVLVSQGQ
ncbi:MAG: nucleotide exchange factor GrpE [Gallionella sp.]|nr:nucleotide exchange factor GrpE [Gallionellaceae bacterium]MDP1870430.1 nucleotide exchange factor GrpE [Gallionella sp.]